MVMCLIVTSIAAFPKSASAGGKTIAFSNEDDQGSIQVNGGDYSNECVIRHSSSVFNEYHLGISYKEVHLKNNGTAWFIYDYKLNYYNYNILDRAMETEIDATQIYDDSTGSAYCYKTPSGEYYYLPSYADLKNQNYVTEKVADSDIPTESTPEQTTPVPTTPAPSPTVSNQPGNSTTTSTPNPTAKATNTPNPSVTKTPGAAQTGYSIENHSSGKKVNITVKEDGQVISDLTFNKKTGKGTFNGKKITKAKDAFIIKDSYNCGYLTKKGKFKVINRKTKKVKTYSGKWKKVVKKGNLATKLKNGKKTKTITGF